MKRIQLLFLAALIGACSKPEKDTLFRKLDAEHHGIDFENTITESDSLNILTLEYIYNGGGVAVADFNNDGKSDLFFTGNMVPNKLYLNKGEFKFEDVSAVAGIGAEKKWKSGVAIADVNGDGWKDIYVCATILPDSASRENMLFIHKGLDANGKPIFEDQAKAYGINYAGHSSGATFLDYDNDNDLDLFIITNSIIRGIPTTYRPKITNGTTNADVLLRNNGDGTFTNVSKEAGILEEGYGLGLGIADINQDGWQDIYVSNDYITNDLLYINNKNGTFTNDIDRCIKHQSMFSMGNDIADFNNDALPDIITLDMLPEGNLRRKTVIGGSTYSSYLNNERYGYAHQYIRNVLQLNNGDGTFSEIGQLAGVHQTEWSWSPLFVDVDNDGFRDLLVTNGFPKDITDKDFASFRAETSTIASARDQIDSIPVVKIPNYAFKNNGDLTFKDVTKAWGLTEPAFSSGASFTDLDNDGDVDYIVNNINDGVMVYENTLYQNERKDTSNYFLRIKLEGDNVNRSGLGSKIYIYYAGKLQYHDQSLSRGYISSVEDIVHFGLGKTPKVDSIVVLWPDKRKSFFKNVNANQALTISQKDASTQAKPVSNSQRNVLVTDVSGRNNIEFVHVEDDKIDFNIQRTIPHKFSQNGPSIAVGDVNGDGLDDFYIGGSSRNDGVIFIQSKSGTFSKRQIKKSQTQSEEDQGALFFDADNDSDLDLYVASGSFEFPENSPAQTDRIYMNDGKGNFKNDPTRLPDSTTSSGSCVRASDVDGDGDLDLFVGGKVVPGQYPYAAKSYLLVNENGRFVDKTKNLAEGLSTVGIVNDALWTDVNNDGKVDLMIAGEFMAITVFQNTGQQFTKLSDTGLEKYSGWWNSLSGGDFDNDGDIDYVAGNLGNNNLYRASEEMPLRVYAKDFDGNNSVDAILSCYLLSEEGDRKEFPVHFWEELNSQSPKFRRQFKYYKKFGRATLDKILSEGDRKDAMVLTANWTNTSYIENLGNGKFTVKALPVRVQTAPVNGIISVDVNGDGFLDIVMVGNDYGNEVNMGRYDAFTGAILINDGQANFRYSTITESGFKVPGDGKAMAHLTIGKQSAIVATQNRDSLKMFTLNTQYQSLFKAEQTDQYAEVIFNTGAKSRVEFYFGSGYLSQSARVLPITKNIVSINVFDNKGNSRTINFSKNKSEATAGR